MQLSAMGAMKTRDESKKLNMYSKQWLPGDTLRVFYPIFWEEGTPQLAVGAVWGHDVGDIKALGLKTAFIPSTCDFDENRLPIGAPDITYQFSNIAPIFVSAMKSQEENAVALKKFPTDAARRDALKAVEEKYDTRNNMNAVKPIIGRVKYYISTEVLSCKLVNDTPVVDTLAVTSAPLSNQTIHRLYNIMADSKYAPEPGDEYLEIEWRYPVDPVKGNSAKAAAPAGVTKEYRLQTTSPSAWKAIEGMLSTIARDSDTITRRATKTINPDKVRQALTQYCILNSEYLDIIGEEDEETLLKNADVVKELDIIQSLENKELIEKLEEAMRKAAALDLPDLSSELPTSNPAEAVANIPETTAEEVEKIDEQLTESMSDLTAVNLQNEGAGQAAVTIQTLLSGSDKTDDANIESLDFTGLV